MTMTRFALLLISFTLVSCADHMEGGGDAVAALDLSGDWKKEVAFEAGSKLGGCAVGDLLPSKSGNEIVVVGGDNTVHLIRRSGVNRYETSLINTLEGELIQVAVGDMFPGTPGDEILAVGAAKGTEDDGGEGVAVCFWRDGITWKWHEVLRSSALVHGVCIADLDGDRKGMEAAVVGYSKEVIVLVPGAEPTSWASSVRASLPSEGKGVAADSSGALMAACAGGELVQVDRDGTTRSMMASEHALARVASDGHGTLVCNNGGELWLVGESGKAQRIHQSADRLRGAVFVTAPDADDQAFATAGYDAGVHLIMGGVARRLASDTDRFHHLAGGSVGSLPYALVACGYAGRVLVIAP